MAAENDVWEAAAGVSAEGDAHCCCAPPATATGAALEGTATAVRAKESGAWEGRRRASSACWCRRSCSWSSGPSMYCRAARRVVRTHWKRPALAPRSPCGGWKYCGCTQTNTHKGGLIWLFSVQGNEAAGENGMLNGMQSLGRNMAQSVDSVN